MGWCPVHGAFNAFNLCMPELQGLQIPHNTIKNGEIMDGSSRSYNKHR